MRVPFPRADVPTRGSRRDLLAASLIVVVLVTSGAHLLWILTGAEPRAWRPYIGNLVFFPMYVSTAALAYLAARRGTANVRRAWAWIGTGLLGWALGQAAYTTLNITTGTNPFPSIADVGYMSLIPCFIIGILHLPRATHGRLQSLSFLLDILIITVAVWDVLWHVSIERTVKAFGDHPFELAVALAYPMFDLALCALALVLLLWRPRGFGAFQLGGMVVGLAAFLAADLLYAYHSGQGTYAVGMPLDAFWTLGAVCVGAAAHAACRAPRHSCPAAPSSGPATTDANFLVPNAVVVISYALFFVVHTDAGDRTHFGTALAIVTFAVLVRQVVGVLDNLRLQRRVAHQAEHDSLTGLLNRTNLHHYLQAAIGAARASGSLVAVLFIDLDRMKHINDTLGHHVGDEVLTQIAARLRQQAGGDAIVARSGGDEFVVIAPGLRDETGAAELADRLLATVRVPVTIGARTAFLTASVGVVLCPRDAQDADTAVNRADAAMDVAKQSGKNRWSMYDETTTANSLEVSHLEARLRGAVARGEFELHYQPIVRMTDRAVVGYEALLRWAPDGAGYIAPTRFIPIAEQHGLIDQVGAWALDTALARVACWRAEHDPALYVTVNVSALEFARPDFVDGVARALARHGQPARALVLELTESGLIQDVAGSVTKLHALRDLGVRVALDDFGTGYSSLSYLQQLPVHLLKIDRSFLRGMDTHGRTLVQGVVTLARGLGLTVVMEGVEHEEHAQALEGLRCDLGQGYWFGRPAPADEAIRLLGRGQKRAG